MDAGRFDTFARMLAQSASRRRILAGAFSAAAVVGARRDRGAAQTCASLGGSCASTEECCDAVSCCGGVCLGLETFLSSSEHCGACNLACAGTCDSGVCRPSGSLDCGAGVVDTLTDAANCGGCGVRCASGFCTGGSCLPCPGSTTECFGICTDITLDPANCGGCGFFCHSGQECVGGDCQLELCPFPMVPCPGLSGGCCNGGNPPFDCATCQIHEICTGFECIGFLPQNQPTCAVGGVRNLVTRDVGVASADGGVTLVARTTTERRGTDYSGDERVRLTLSVIEGSTPQIRIDAVASRDHGIALAAEYGPAFAGVRNLSVRSENGSALTVEADNRGAGVTPVFAVEPAFAATAGEFDAALAGDLGACFAGGAEATPLAASPVPDGDADCQPCLDVCGDALGACFPPAGAACVSDPTPCISSIFDCTEAYWICADSCPC